MIRHFVLGLLLALPAFTGLLGTKLGPYADGHGLTIDLGPNADGNGLVGEPGETNDRDDTLTLKLGPYADGNG